MTTTCGDEFGGHVCALDKGHECFHAAFRSALAGPEPVAVWPHMTESVVDQVPGQLWRQVKSENQALNCRHAALCAEVTALKDTIVRLTMGGARA